MDHHYPVHNSAAEPEDDSFNYGPSVSGDVVELLFGEVTPQSELVNFLRDPRTDLFVLNSYPIVREVLLNLILQHRHPHLLNGYFHMLK